MSEEKEQSPEQKVEDLKSGLFEKIKGFSHEVATGLLKRFALMAESESNEDVKQDAETKLFTPPLVKGQVVQVRFTGQGTSLNGKHFALIWKVNPKEGQVVVLPMSSKKDRTQGMYDLGPIKGLRSPVNLVLFQQSHTVARQSIHIWTRRIRNNETGENETIPTQLEEFQMKHMESLFRYTHLKEKDLFFKICFETKNRIPEFIPDELLMHINRHIKVTITEDKVTYKLPHETEFKEFPLVNLPVGTKKRYQLLAGFLSSDETIRIAVKQEVHDLLTNQSEKS